MEVTAGLAKKCEKFDAQLQHLIMILILISVHNVNWNDES